MLDDYIINKSIMIKKNHAVYMLQLLNRHIENEDVTMSPRKRAIRYNPAILPPDNIDWL